MFNKTLRAIGMTNHVYLIDSDGNLRFTRKGLDELTSYFANSGIDIKTIKTLDDYYKARKEAAPMFMDMLVERSNRWSHNSEFDLLRTALFDHPDDEVKRKLRIVE
ncbi:MAG: hypothetical protein HOM14_03815 [Gammaproteobacteria bacterium]|jgi:hypothetical protein|nr:hypothetical protein [Gammaproteobacteria bacterium]MBT4451251.1 hypothetical protein [Gammaproteobacteria bacterium]MBT6550462.1 hypothetical protein [Gammaproteobacteria bacterium]MBT6703178.1 hypothetical protein [Gammaproteobacteria bacterium]MBT7043824.1 hypothetical protein [Gammaproteobacteria bacterium]